MLDILESGENKDSMQESLLENRIMARLCSEELQGYIYILQLGNALKFLISSDFTVL